MFLASILDYLKIIRTFATEFQKPSRNKEYALHRTWQNGNEDFPSELWRFVAGLRLP